jgi:flagellar basal body-associated protein FliL
MNRLVVPLVVLALAGGVYFLLSYRPTGGQVKSAAPASVASTPPLTDAEVPLAPRPAPATATVSGEAPATAPAAPAGPFEVIMGEYKIALRDSQRRMRMTLVLTTSNPDTRKEIQGRREQLRRMIFFLSAHRSEETMVGNAGRDRFLADLRERFDNVIRTGALDRMEITLWELEETPAAPPSEASPGTIGEPR